MKIIFRFQTSGADWSEYVEWGDARVPVAGEMVTLLQRGQFLVTAVYWSAHRSAKTDVVGAEVILR